MDTKSARGPNLARQTHGEHLRPRRFQAVMSEDEGKSKKFRGKRDILGLCEGWGMDNDSTDQILLRHSRPFMLL